MIIYTASSFTILLSHCVFDEAGLDILNSRSVKGNEK